MPGFFKLFLWGCLYMCVFVRVGPPPRLLITNGVMWHDMNLYDWLNKFYSCYMEIVVITISELDLSIDTRRKH